MSNGALTWRDMIASALHRNRTETARPPYASGAAKPRGVAEGWRAQGFSASAAAKRLVWSCLSVVPDRPMIALQHFRRFGQWPNLDHPTTFNEKVSWRKLHQRDPRFPVFADKLAAKSEVARLIGSRHVVPTLWAGTDPDEIPFERLRPPYVIKVNHSAGSNIFIHRDRDVDTVAISKALRHHLRMNHGGRHREWGYQDIPRRIFVEQMIFSERTGDLPEDYKFFVFHGRAHFVQVDHGRYTDHRRSIYSRDWEKMPIVYNYPDIGGLLPRPPNYDEMLACAERVGAQFDFARVDFYDTGSEVLFGEVTFYPEAGHGTFAPATWDASFGGLWRTEAAAA